MPSNLEFKFFRVTNCAVSCGNSITDGTCLLGIDSQNWRQTNIYEEIKFTLDVDMAFCLFCFHRVRSNTYLLKKFKTVSKFIIYLYVSDQFSHSVVSDSW